MSNTRDFGALQKRRMRAANLLRRGLTQAQVDTSSGAGVKGFAGQAAYTAAKHGVSGARTRRFPHAYEFATDRR